MKMRRCEDEKMFYRPPLLEEPCAQTLSGNNCPSTLTAVTGGDKGAGLENGGGIKLKAFKVPREGEKKEDPRPESATRGPASASEGVEGGGAPDEEMPGEERRNRKRPAIEAGVEGSEQEPKEPRVEELGGSWR